MSEEITHYEILFRGGTRIRIPAGRGPDKPYDLLLRALKDAQAWHSREATWGEWMSAAECVKRETLQP